MWIFIYLLIKWEKNVENHYTSGALHFSLQGVGDKGRDLSF